MTSTSLCSVEGCVRTSYGETGWCRAHYQRVRKTGDPQADKPLRMVGAPLADRFWSKVTKVGPDECWTWSGSVDKTTGYARFGVSASRTMNAHRIAYELAVGPIPAGLQIDHLCRNRACVNPAHMEPVTQAENIRRGEAPKEPPSAARQREMTHCHNGHPFDDENTYHYDNQRHCRTCRRETARRLYWRRRGDTT